MDLTEVNFELASSPQERAIDENTFRDLLEVVVDSVNRPTNRSAILPEVDVDQSKLNSAKMRELMDADFKDDISN